MGPVDLATEQMALPAARRDCEDCFPLAKKEKAKNELKKEAKKEEKPKEEKPKEAEKPKEEKPAASQGKAKNPLDLLPASPFDLDNWKRIYSNTHSDFYSVMDKFWPMFDKEGWSCWICEYMYNEENTRGFMTANLVSGFIQRSDSLRKYAFGNMNILKDANEPFYRVMGGWLIRGTAIQPMLDENPDAAYYNWRKVDETNEDDKKLLADLWCASESIQGKEINSNEVFK